jgi:hypothetical protein
VFGNAKDPRINNLSDPRAVRAGHEGVTAQTILAQALSGRMPMIDAGRFLSGMGLIILARSQDSGCPGISPDVIFSASAGVGDVERSGIRALFTSEDLVWLKTHCPGINLSPVTPRGSVKYRPFPTGTFPVDLTVSAEPFS